MSEAAATAEIELSSLQAVDACEVHLGGNQFAIVIRRDESVFAYANACPHMGRALNWAPNKFMFTPEDELICAMHGAVFDVATGESTAGPCKGAGLRPIRCDVVNDRVLLYSD